MLNLLFWFLVKVLAYVSLLLVTFNFGCYLLLQGYVGLFRSQNLKKKVGGSCGVVVAALRWQSE